MTDAEKARSRANLEHLMATGESTNRLSYVRATKKPVRGLALGFAAVLAGATLILGNGHNCVYRCEPLAERAVKSMTPEMNTVRQTAHDATNESVTNESATDAKGTAMQRPLSSVNLEPSTEINSAPGTLPHSNSNIQPVSHFNRLPDHSAASEPTEHLTPKMQSCCFWKQSDTSTRTQRGPPRQHFGPKTQGEPYHGVIVAVGILVEAHFPGAALLRGDVDEADAGASKRWAEKVLGRALPMPVLLDAPNLIRRLSQQWQGGALLRAFVRRFHGEMAHAKPFAHRTADDASFAAEFGCSCSFMICARKA